MRRRFAIAKLEDKGRNWRIDAVIFSVMLFVGAMLFLASYWQSARDLDHLEIPLRLYWMEYPTAWVMLAVLLWILGRQAEVRTTGGVAWCIILIAFITRLIVVFGTQPVLSDDIWRYIHDGATFAQGTNPYRYAPVDFPGGIPVPGVVDRINNPELVTIYQPTSQYVFAGLDRLWAISPDVVKQWDPNHDKIFRLGFVLFDMVLIAVILAWLRDMGKSAWWAVAYAWHPLAISEVAGSGHQDVVGIAFLVLSLYLASRLIRSVNGASKPLAASHPVLCAVGAGVAFALALAVKPIVLPIAFVLAWMLRKRPTLIAWAAGATILTGVALYLPFILMDGGLAGMIDTGRMFVDKWAFNGLLYDLFVTYIAGKPWADRAAMLTLLIVLIVSKLREPTNPARPASAFLFASLLVSSTVHPWYLLWALALMPMGFSLAFWVFSLTVAASYAAHLYEGYRVPPWVVIGEYLPVYAVLGWGVINGWRGDRMFSGRSQIAGS